jgi:phospholipid/cholesterol/gamma-HCH transport system permease protein
MTAQDGTLYDSDARQLLCRGDWDLASLPQLKALFEKISWPKSGEITIDGTQINKMDSAGAWLLSLWQKKLKQQGINVRLEKFNKAHQTLLTIVEKKMAEEKPLPNVVSPNGLARVGKAVCVQFSELFDYLSFVGQLSYEALRIIGHPKHLRWASIVNVIYRNGYQALPIIALLSFMIGVVITFQLGLQLRSYGANVYIVDLLGLSILREFGPLITAIMVAGRTGSAFTAELGMMKLNQEIDALNTIGVTPGELLLLPRIMGLLISLPLLTAWSDTFGVLGGMVMANNMLHITWYDFLHRFPHVIPLRAFLIGLGKAPVFALIIASIGCFQGMKVEGGADSVGRNTTRSVVLAIFFIIIADAIFSVIFSKLKL